jgi:hypothetical protein
LPCLFRGDPPGKSRQVLDTLGKGQVISRAWK